MKVHLRIRLHTAQSRAAEDTAPFGSIPAGRVPSVAPLLGSVALHVLAIGLIVTASWQMALYFQEDRIDWSRYRVEPLRLHLSEPLYFRGSQPEKALVRRARRRAGAAAEETGTATAAKPAVPRGLELPSPSEAVKNGAVILQPEFRREAARLAALPPLAFWARQSADLPQPPPPKQVLVPGRIEEPSPAAKLAATPTVAVPNREQAAADINISLPPAAAHEQPALAMANSATVPVRLRKTGETRTASLDDTLSGQPITVLALGTEHMRHVEIPRGLQNLPGSSEDGAAGAAAGNDESDSRGPQVPTSRSLGNGPSAAAADSTASAVPEVSTEAEAAPAAAKTTRIEHPANGVFNIVVTQSVPEDLADAEGLLTGSPVHTVYLRVGDRKEWLLKYCVPAGERPQSSPYQVFMGDATPLTPPYPISTIIPNSILAQPIPKQIVLHGLLTSGGHLRNVKAAAMDHPAAAQILPLLNEWQFRPALRTKRPIDIEILLVIPARDKLEEAATN
jgi:hypothetical protein